VVDAALGLQKRGHNVDIFTSYHDPNHCFDETRDGAWFSLLPRLVTIVTQHYHCLGRLKVHHVRPPLPRSIAGKFHILFAHLRQLHLTLHLLNPRAPKYDVYFVDQLSTCVPFLRMLGRMPVVFYCHFPDKLLAHGAFVEGKIQMKGGLLKKLYRLPMDWLEEVTTRTTSFLRSLSLH
jgi:alpha-1,3/alpha-1,6-mannosyltransferase